jgi:RimJ/RimL family protein N-acetyltransferase
MLKTERTILRPIELKDNEEILKYRSDSETNKYQSWIPKDLEEVNQFINKNPNQFNIPNTWFQLVILKKDSNEIVGDVGIHFKGSDNMQCELGCTLKKEYHGRGYATEAVKVVIDHLFNKLNKHRIITSIDPENTSSIKLVEKLGFRKEAHFKKSIMINGEWVDDIIYAILKTEWK